MAEAWVCPQCGSRWIATQGKCFQCGYDEATMAVEPAPAQPAPLTGDALLAHLFPPDVAPVPPQPPAPVPAETRELHALRQALPQVVQERDEARERLQGVLASTQQLLAPLMQWWQEQGQQVSYETVIPQTVQVLHALRQRPAVSQVPTTTPGAQLVQVLSGLQQTLEALRQQMATPPIRGQAGHLHTEAELAYLEQTMQRDGLHR